MRTQTASPTQYANAVTPLAIKFHLFHMLATRPASASGSSWHFGIGIYIMWWISTARFPLSCFLNYVLYIIKCIISYWIPVAGQSCAGDTICHFIRVGLWFGHVEFSALNTAHNLGNHTATDGTKLHLCLHLNQPAMLIKIASKARTNSVYRLTNCFFVCLL